MYYINVQLFISKYFFYQRGDWAYVCGAMSYVCPGAVALDFKNVAKKVLIDIK